MLSTRAFGLAFAVAAASWQRRHLRSLSTNAPSLRLADGRLSRHHAPRTATLLHNARLAQNDFAQSSIASRRLLSIGVRRLLRSAGSSSTRNAFRMPARLAAAAEGGGER